MRIGILGAARIADQAIVTPAQVLGHELVAIAARDRARAEEYAAKHGIARVHETYAEVIADPGIDMIYNPLVNSLHAEWNIAALRAGKHVLSEKPLSSNAAETRRVRAVARESSGRLVEAFHYRHHPVNLRLRDLVTSGALGEIRSVDLVLAIPAPPPTDPRWSLELAGGATMDLGCYVLDAARTLGDWIGAEARITGVDVTLWAPEVDSAMQVEFAYDGGVTGRGRWDMAADDLTMTWTVTGTAGTAVSQSFAIPHFDNRITVTRAGRTEDEVLGDQTSYTYQLARFAENPPDELDGSVATAELMDECYRRAGLTPRG
ncbi:Gfo/Idh/MocA family oxidoreductase [Actinoplanes sp. NBC_00393]|uniref:Gfo/Idh/MocA family protein n=1 Tax=Actinoplanes sp. NBC_00393 TaxID=2975953 RepID=UPI002E20401C